MGADGGWQKLILIHQGRQVRPADTPRLSRGGLPRGRSCSRAGEEEKSGRCKTPKRINSVCSCFPEK